MFSQQFLSTKVLMSHLHQLQNRKITGSLKLWGDPYLSWTLYFYRGHCIWLSGGAHPQERWQRHLELFLPQIGPTELAKIACPPSPYREYLLLGQLLQRGSLVAKQCQQLLTSLVLEGLFDIIQYRQNSEHTLSYQTISHQIPNFDTPSLPTDQLRMKALLSWQKWQQAGLTAYSPNLFPVISQPSLLLEYASPQVYQLVRTQVNGTRSLRLLAKNSQQDVLTLTKSLQPLVAIGALSLSPLPSFKKFNLPPSVANPTTHLSETKQQQNAPLIACVDDSQMVCQTLEVVLTQQGYRFLGIQESLKAATILLNNKPDLILLDLVMPQVNGYQLCTLLRKTNSLKKVPIVFLTAKDGLLDRMKAKVVGANGYLSKPVTAEQVVATIEKYLTAKNNRPRSKSTFYKR